MITLDKGVGTDPMPVPQSAQAQMPPMSPSFPANVASEMLEKLLEERLRGLEARHRAETDRLAADYAELTRQHREQASQLNSLRETSVSLASQQAMSQTHSSKVVYSEEATNRMKQLEEELQLQRKKNAMQLDELITLKGQLKQALLNRHPSSYQFEVSSSHSLSLSSVFPMNLD